MSVLVRPQRSSRRYQSALLREAGQRVSMLRPARHRIGRGSFGAAIPVQSYILSLAPSIAAGDDAIERHSGQKRNNSSAPSALFLILCNPVPAQPEPG
jgi:hypothetical protein